MSTLPLLKINPEASATERTIEGKQVCVIVDDFLLEPEKAVDYAANHADAFGMPEKGYPGLVLDIDDGPMEEIYRFMKQAMSRRFGFMRGGMAMSTVMSMATLPPEKLGNLQRLCHTDPRTRPGHLNYASLLYLFDNEELGGTAFYRWKNPDAIREAMRLESGDPVAAKRYLEETFESYRERPAYLTESTDVAERLGSVPAKFNRFIFYSGEIPHSAHIMKPEDLSEDFRTGRLTLNCFASVRPGT